MTLLEMFEVVGKGASLLTQIFNGPLVFCNLFFQQSSFLFHGSVFSEFPLKRVIFLLELMKLLPDIFHILRNSVVVGQ